MTEVHRTRLQKITRKANTRSGNPVKVLWTTNGKFVTKRDAACAYEIPDYVPEGGYEVVLLMEYGQVIGFRRPMDHPSTTGCRVHGITRCTICHPACHCECQQGGFCGGCGHAGCGGRR